MDDLTKWLKARESEREEDANEGHGLYCAALDPCYEPPKFGDPDYSRCDCKKRWTLADIAAKRRIIEWCVEVIGERDLSRYGESGLLKDDPDALAVTLAVETLKLLALPFSDRPGYRAEEWRP